MKIPIVFATDKNLVMQTGVCITSLLLNSKGTDFYDIYIIVDKSVDEEARSQLKLIRGRQGNNLFSISFIQIENRFEKEYSYGHFTSAVYFRLLIPELIQGYDRIFYSDVDIIFRQSLSTIYTDINLDNYYLAASKCEADHNYIRSIGCNPYSYFCSGFLLINSKKMLEDGLVDLLMELTTNNKFTYADQDILNIACKNKALFFPPLLYGFDQGIYQKIMNNIKIQAFSFTEEEVKFALTHGLIHYTGKQKPWNYPCYRYDIWWNYYRLSSFYNEDYCYSFYKKSFIGDFLDFKHRVKLLIRFFITKERLSRLSIKKLFKN